MYTCTSINQTPIYIQMLHSLILAPVSNILDFNTMIIVLYLYYIDQRKAKEVVFLVYYLRQMYNTTLYGDGIIYFFDI